MKAIMIVFSVSVAIVPSIINFFIITRDGRFNLVFDIYLLSFLASLLLLNIILLWLFYTFAKLNEATEDEWYASWQSRRKHQKVFLAVTYSLCIIVLLFALLHSYSFTYLRYMTESGAKQASAEVSFYTSEKTEVILDGSTPEGTVFRGWLSNNDIVIKIKLKKIPDNAALYVNGKEAEMDSIGTKFHFFWEDEYFESSAYSLIDLNRPGEVNTLEIKTNSFDKVWTFILDGDEGEET